MPRANRHLTIVRALAISLRYALTIRANTKWQAVNVHCYDVLWAGLCSGDEMADQRCQALQRCRYNDIN